MLKRIFYILSAIVLLASCRYETYVSYTQTETVYESVPVLVSVGSTPHSMTKASGSVDTEEAWKWKDARIHVYSFRSNADGFHVCSTDGDAECLIDGAADGCVQAGRAALLDERERYVVWEAEEDHPYYPEGYDRYDFFAYYIDDCVVDDSRIIREKDYISMPVTITGAQDVMTAKAELRREHLDTLEYTDAHKQAILDASYSAYTANNGVHPELYFKHHLVKLTFEAYPGREEVTQVTVQEVSVKSRTQAVLTVVHRDSTRIGLDFSADPDREPLLLMEKDYQSVMDRDRYRMPWSDSEAGLPVYERTPLQLGGALLVSPEENYDCTIKICADGVDDIPYEFKINSADGKFTAGNHYAVRLAVYGKFAIECDVVVEDWQDGGSYDIDVK